MTEAERLQKEFEEISKQPWFQKAYAGKTLHELFVTESDHDLSEWEKVYEIGVDSALCWIGDPGYCVTPDCDEQPAPTWAEFCAHLRQMNNMAGGYATVYPFPFKAGHEGLGVAVSTCGDGSFPVYVRRRENGQVAEVRIVFDE